MLGNWKWLGKGISALLTNVYLSNLNFQPVSGSCSFCKSEAFQWLEAEVKQIQSWNKKQFFNRQSNYRSEHAVASHEDGEFTISSNTVVKQGHINPASERNCAACGKCWRERTGICICYRLSNGFLVIARIQGINGNLGLSCSSEMLSSYSSSQARVDRDKRMKLSGFRVLRLECIPLDLHTVKWRMWEVCSSFTGNPFMPETLHKPHGTLFQQAHHWWCWQMSPGPSR